MATPRLGRLAPEDQLRQVDDEGRQIAGPETPAIPSAESAAPADAVGGPAAPPEVELASAGLDRPMASPPPESQDALTSEELTPEEIDRIPDLLPLIDQAIAPDADPEPADSILNLEDKALISLFEARITAAQSFRQPYEDKWMDAWKAYHQVLDGDQAKWKSKVFVPMVTQQVEAALPAFVAAIFDSGPIWVVAPTKPEREQQAKALTKVLDWYMREKTPAARRLRDWLWSSTLFGTGFLRVRWKYEEGTKRAMAPTYLGDKESGQQIFLANRKEVTPGSVLFNHPVLENVDLWNSFPAPHTKDDDSWPWFIEYLESTMGGVDAAAESGEMGDEAPERVAKWKVGNPDQESGTDGVFGVIARKAEAFHQVGLSDSADQAGLYADPSDRKNNQVRLYRMSTPDADVYFSSDGTMVLGKARNPYFFREIPIVAHHFIRIPGRIFGRGIYDVVGDLQRQVNFNYNKGNDAVQLALNSPIAVRRGGNALIDGQVLWQPGVIVPCRDPSTDIVPLKMTNPIGDVFALEQHLMVHADRATGVNDISRGESPSGANTATEFAGLQSQVRLRLSQHVREIRTSMGRIGRLVLMMTQQFVDQPLAIRIAGSAGLDWVHVSPDDVTGEYDVIPSANSTRSNPTLMRTDTVALLPHMLSHPEIVRQDKVWKHIFNVFEFPTPEEMVLPPPPPPRDPRVEEIALAQGSDVDPSPDENFDEHMRVHAMAEMAEQASPNPNPLAYAARKKHMEKTIMLQSQVLMAQMGAAAAAPAGGGAGPGGTEARREATSLGKGQGSDGPPGASPGPSAPGRPGAK